jgi:DNA helicase-2/ATP-dependent DNA helicase PcrA
VADADADTYRTETDRQNLYVACTRALHRLRVFHTGTATPLLPADR